jgi:DNA mismatch endonuclease (patch repair protein)
MSDSLTKSERSQLMAKVRGTGNRSTEAVVEAALRAERIRGWKKHPEDVPGRPDFYFPRYRLAIFVDGCFWHACPNCGRIPKSNVELEDEDRSEPQTR